jgi:hypothetical protein
MKEYLKEVSKKYVPSSQVPLPKYISYILIYVSPNEWLLIRWFRDENPNPMF